MLLHTDYCKVQYEHNPPGAKPIGGREVGLSFKQSPNPNLNRNLTLTISTQLAIWGNLLIEFGVN